MDGRRRRADGRRRHGAHVRRGARAARMCAAARADVPLLPCMLLLCRPLKHCNNVVCWPVFYYVQEKVKLHQMILTRSLTFSVWLARCQTRFNRCSFSDPFYSWLLYWNCWPRAYLSGPSFHYSCRCFRLLEHLSKVLVLFCHGHFSKLFIE